MLNAVSLFVQVLGDSEAEDGAEAQHDEVKLNNDKCSFV